MSGSSSREATSAAGDGNYKLEIKEYGGGKGPVRWFFKEDSCVAMIDVPGCSVAPSSYSLEKTHVGFQTEEVDQNNHSLPVRTYIGFVKFPAVYDSKHAKIWVVNGVLWITVTKHQGRQG
ncbi:14.7 kDa heat shock-like protein [Arabidopsis thaliana]|uniref:14.7 kDa heat shock-like protein n=1 Tax=Arabidopsis thaliana TaxID=3702 RepID=Q3EDD8_ARATH|nr:14.7 kDa heat shock-like protein [Arabidopsis thaliana]AEE28846.1 14.7 kDa heat shock-like protein [Arabidopsis thaliana]|eukprot:NP_172682.1 14.7 kDa heat shock-like protein [Arabidopsis thaliana]